MAKNYYDITLALAGICQSASLVQQLAHQGQADDRILTLLFRSLMERNPASTLAVYGDNEQNLRPGLEVLPAILNATNRQGPGAELTRYMLSLMLLARRLSRNKTALNTLGERLTQLDRQLAYYELTSDPITSAIAGIYVDVVSPLAPRIQVTGSPAVLQNSQIQARVRATLLTGIRAAILWYQVGGSRLQLLFSRSRLVTGAKHILARMPPA